MQVLPEFMGFFFSCYYSTWKREKKKRSELGHSNHVLQILPWEGDKGEMHHIMFHLHKWSFIPADRL